MNKELVEARGQPLAVIKCLTFLLQENILLFQVIGAPLMQCHDTDVVEDTINVLAIDVTPAFEKGKNFDKFTIG